MPAALLSQVSYFVLGREPAPALRGVVDVVAEAEYQQRRRHRVKPAHCALHAARARDAAVNEDQIFVKP